MTLTPLESRGSPALLWSSPFDARLRATAEYAFAVAAEAWGLGGDVTVRRGIPSGLDGALAAGRPGEVWVGDGWPSWHLDPHTPPASGERDGLTVLVHELGHAAGLGHEASGVMQPLIPLGVRRLPEVDLPGAYQPWWSGPVSVAVSPTQTVVSPGIGGGPNVRTFDAGGHLTGSWYAMSPDWHGGVTSDTWGPVVVTGAMPGGGPRVQVRIAGEVRADFFAFDAGFHGGVSVAAGDGWVAVGAGPGGGPRVNVYDWSGRMLRSSYAGPESDTGGVGFSTASGEFGYRHAS